MHDPISYFQAVILGLVQGVAEPFPVSSPNVALAIPNEPMWVGCVSIAGDAEAQAWYQQTRLPVFAWSAQARGFFSGRIGQS